MARKRRREIVGGYAWKREMTRAKKANDAARAALMELHGYISSGEDVCLELMSMLVAEAALALGENAAALGELEEIGRAGG